MSNDPGIETEEFEYLWKWFEVHITHRTQMLNFFDQRQSFLPVDDN